jgi:hypothetical protein
MTGAARDAARFRLPKLGVSAPRGVPAAPYRCGG